MMAHFKLHKILLHFIAEHITNILNCIHLSKHDILLEKSQSETDSNYYCEYYLIYKKIYQRSVIMYK